MQLLPVLEPRAVVQQQHGDAHDGHARLPEGRQRALRCDATTAHAAQRQTGTAAQAEAEVCLSRRKATASTVPVLLTLLTALCGNASSMVTSARSHVTSPTCAPFHNNPTRQHASRRLRRVRAVRH